MNVASIFAHMPGDRPCLLFDGATQSYAQIRARAAGVRARLLAEGVGRGDFVALVLPNGPEFVASYLGVLSLGAVAVCINPMLAEVETAFILADSACRLALAQGDVAARLSLNGLPVLDAGIGPAPGAWASEEVPDDHPAVIVYSSGTSGRPKGVMLSHGNAAFTARSKVRYMGVTGADRLLLFLPLHHCFGQNAILLPGLFAGASVVLQRRFDRAAVLQSLRTDGVTMVFGVPTTFLALEGRITPADSPAVRYWFSAAAPLPLEVEERWHRHMGLPIHQGYGQTECSPFATYNHIHSLRRGKVGTAINGVELRIVDPADGRDLPAGEAGEIVLRGPNVMLGYLNRPEDTAKAIRQGWLHTGDIGRLDAEGYLSVEDRLTDLIIVGGRNVYPAEVENALYAHPAVAEAAVYGVSDPFLGEEVWANVVLKPSVSVDAQELEAVCRRSLAAYKVPTAFVLVDALPRNPTGKILKRELRAAARPVAQDPARRERGSELDSSRLESWVRDWLGRHLNLSPGAIERDRAFAEYGLDSVLGVALARELAAPLGRSVDLTLVWEASTLAGLLARLREAGAASAGACAVPAAT
ncbi:UNVERIFIED_ORG: long-chain acyl-CoA synthetase [Xanthobacter viscosus]|uniref:3-methylmercaptopropionyl-CoA ligase n=1 Tax=Xanthobacter autotrophicus TaxID=280 RepID=A0A6C1KK59_XANAU|nr:AMP-binding protein [Xanthobacter autotrophicus]TLX44610.1 long-chain fatty acid--CoA ligase [Xanthobacter autotrophicus]